MEVDKKQKVCCRFPCCNAQVRNKGKDIKGEDKVLKFCSQHESAACREAPREPLSLPLAELLGEETVRLVHLVAFILSRLSAVCVLTSFLPLFHTRRAFS